jgi:hypothetical protein
MGMQVVEVKPFPGHPYCNKIEQCSGDAFSGYEAAVLCDCDLFFNSSPELPLTFEFAGTTVDLPNPPLPVVNHIYKLRGVQPSIRVPARCALSRSECTLRSNLNGGFYLLGTHLMNVIGEQWRTNALWLLDRVHLLRGYEPHVDQVAMALTLDQLAINVTLLPQTINSPVHLPAERLMANLSEEIAVIHYHSQMQFDTGKIQRTNVVSVDKAIDKANASIREILSASEGDAEFQRWRDSLFADSRSSKC